MALREHFDGFNRRLQVAFHLGGGLGSRVRKAERMQREREGFQVAAIGVVRLFHRVTSVCLVATNALGFWNLMSRVGAVPGVVPQPPGLREFLMRLSHAPAKGQGIGLHKVVHEVKENRAYSALEALFGELDKPPWPGHFTKYSTLVPRACSRSSTNAFHVA